MTEQENIQRNSRLRLLFTLLLASAAVLLIGASRIGDSIATRQAEQEQARSQWQFAARSLLHHYPQKLPDSREMKQLAVRHPEYFLQAVHLGLHPESGPDGVQR